MPSTAEQTKPVPHPFKMGIANFIQRNRGLLLILLLSMLALLVATAVWFEIDKNIKFSFISKVESVQEKFSAWKSEPDAEKKKALESDLEAGLDEIIKNAPSSYPLAQTQFMKGTYLFEKEKWKDSAEIYKAVFWGNRTSYLAPVSLLNAAVSLENAGESEAALAAYEEFISAYPENKLYLPQVYFSKGRILEVFQKNAEAIASYKAAADKFPESDWTKLGRARIIILNSN